MKINKKIVSGFMVLTFFLSVICVMYQPSIAVKGASLPPDLDGAYWIEPVPADASTGDITQIIGENGVSCFEPMDCYGCYPTIANGEGTPYWNLTEKHYLHFDFWADIFWSGQDESHTGFAIIIVDQDGEWNPSEESACDLSETYGEEVALGDGWMRRQNTTERNEPVHYDIDLSTLGVPLDHISQIVWSVRCGATWVVDCNFDILNVYVDDSPTLEAPAPDPNVLLSCVTEGNYSSELSLMGTFSNTAYNRGMGPIIHVPANESYKISTLTLYLRKEYNPTADIAVRLYQTNGTFGTTTCKPTNYFAESEPINASTLSTSRTLINFTFSGDQQKIMDLDATYTCVLVALTSGLTSSNCVDMGYSYSQVITGGYSTTAPWGWYSVGQSPIFYLYGVENEETVPNILNRAISFDNYRHATITANVNTLPTGGTLSSYILESNNTVSGNYENQTFTFSSTPQDISITLNLVYNYPDRIAWRLYANLSSGIMCRTDAMTNQTSFYYDADLDQQHEGFTVAEVTNPYAIRWQEKPFYCNGRYWHFYINGSSQYSDGRAMFSSSLDGEVWDHQTTLAKYTYEISGENIQTICHGGYVDVFLRCINSTDGLNYKRGLPQSNGSITWLTEFQTFWNATTGNHCDFYAARSTDGHLYVSWSIGASGALTACKPYIIKNALDNGTWATAEGYPIQVSTLSAQNNFIHALPDGRIYLIFFQSYPWASNVTGVMIEDDEVGTPELVTTTGIYQQYSFGLESWSRSSGVDSLGNIHMLFLGSNNNLMYCMRNQTAWGPSVTVHVGCGNFSSPAIIVNGEQIQALWILNQTYIVYKNKVGDVWDSTPQTLIYEPDDLALNDPINYGRDGRLNGFVQGVNGYLGLTWVSNSSTAGRYLIKFLLFAAPLSVFNIAYSTTAINENCLFSSYWNDFTGLDYWFFSWNGTGSAVNETATKFSATPAWANITKTLPPLPSSTVAFQWYANNTSGDILSSGVTTFALTGTLPSPTPTPTASPSEDTEGNGGLPNGGGGNSDTSTLQPTEKPTAKNNNHIFWVLIVIFAFLGLGLVASSSKSIKKPNGRKMPSGRL